MEEIPLLPTPTTMDSLDVVRTPGQLRELRKLGGGRTLREVAVHLALGTYEEAYDDNHEGEVVV